jgi:uncharacterized membrane protein YraQ (UPF0718 family)
MLLAISGETVHIFNETAIYILFGFLLSGVIKVYLPADRVFRYLGGRDVRSVLIAALLGIPLPLCSCAVLPTAVSLKRQGAGKGATLSFLISTPETGIDSISVTYALIDPVMTVFRPFSALITAVTAGISANYLDRRAAYEDPGEMETGPACGDEGCHCEEGKTQKKGLMGVFHYAFVELLNDIVFWLVFGIVIAGAISALIPDDLLRDYLGTGIVSMLVMVMLGVPVYMCAASSTPVAASLIMKGLNPGAALVFLLTGPATNAGTIAIVGRLLGKKMMAVYVGTIVAVSILLGFLLNGIYLALGIDAAAAVGTASEKIPPFLKLLGSYVLLSIIIRNLWVTGRKNLLRSAREKWADFTGMGRKG